MRGLRIIALLALAAAGLAAAMPGRVEAQAPVAADAQRDCQTVRQCRFTKGGSYRGCISAYTCRVCRPVVARCRVGARSETCRQIRCTWGG